MYARARAVFIDNRRNRVPVIESGVSDNKQSAARLLLQLPMQSTRSRMKREMSMAIAAAHAGACRTARLCGKFD